ncbi:AMP-binding protein [Streptomyces fuscichromogenes]|uniref:AMP-binding protein n=1 Tax=Streptomyces fuscichromogenes TaxID=1324013 RepID=UPI003822304F
MAMRYISGGRTLEQADLDDLARRVASGLAEQGVGDGDGIGLLLVNEIEVIVCWQALSLLGAYAVPLNWRSTTAEVSYIAADAALKAIVAHDTVRGVAREALGDGGMVVSVPLPAETADALSLPRQTAPGAYVDWNDWLTTQPPWPGDFRPARPAVTYTSGTTGKPKGVMREAHLSAEARELQARHVAPVWGSEDHMRSLLLAPLYHSAPSAYIRSAIATAKTAGEIHMQPRFDPETVLRTIESARITHLWMVPTMFVRLLQLPAEVRERYDVSSLRNIVHSGAPCPVDVKTRMIDWFGPVINEFYGSTETGPITYATSADYLKRPGTVGRVLEACRVAIIDADGRRLPPNTPGEIAAANGTYADFTYRHRESDREQLDAGGLLRTGDIGVLDEDGYLFIKDRLKDMVISGGVNVYPAEVEEVLLQLTNIQDGAVFGLPDEVYGERLAAAVSLAAPEPGAADRIRAELRERLASVKVPRTVFVLDDFPRADNGKVSKARLRQLVTTTADNK